MKFSFSEIRMAFDFVSSREEGDNIAYVAAEEGEIFYYSEPLGLNEIRGIDIHSATCHSLPHRESLNLGQELAFDFVDERFPEEYSRVRDVFTDGETSRERFREMLESAGRLREWEEYESARVAEVLGEWCGARGIVFDG